MCRAWRRASRSCDKRVVPSSHAGGQWFGFWLLCPTQKSFNVTAALELFVLYVRETHECGRIRTAAATSQKTAQKQRGSRNPPAPTHLTAPVCKHTGAVLFLSAQGCSSMQHTLEVEKNGAFVTNLSQKDYKRPFSPRKDCETIVYLVSYRGDWPSVPVCEKK